MRQLLIEKDSRDVLRYACYLIAENKSNLNFIEICVIKGRYQRYVGILYSYCTSTAPKTINTWCQLLRNI